MPIFEIQGPDGDVFEVDAPNEQAAISALNISPAPSFVAPEPPPGAVTHSQGRGFPTPEAERDFILQQEAQKRASGLSSVQSLAPVMQGLGFQSGDELAGGLAAAGQQIGGSPNTFAEDFEANRRAVNIANQQAHAANPKTAFAGEVLGSVATGLTLPMLTPFKGAGIGAKIGNTAATGAGIGGVAGFAAGDPGSRAQNAAIGTAFGAGLGGVSQGVLSGASAAMRPITSRLTPDRAIKSYLASLLQRSGQGVDDITGQMAAAGREGQGDVFMLADALGHPGQRAMSSIARTPNEARTSLVEALQSRQAGQSRRVSNQLAKAFDAPDTAAQRTAALTTARGEAANIAYDAASAGAGPVSVAKAVGNIDDLLSTYPAGKISKSLKRAKRAIADGKTDSYDTVLAAKKEIGDEAFRSRGTNKGRLLNQVNRDLDEALEAASPAFRQANDEFAAASRVIESVDEGRQAARTGRADDTIPDFLRRTPEQQAAYRAGFADPLIAKTEKQAFGNNAARPFVNEAFQREAAAISPKGDMLNRQLAREMTMAETRNAALGGSKTADNLADAAEFAAFDPTVVGSLMSGNFLQAGKSATARVLAEMGGMPPNVAKGVAERLSLTSSDAARMALVKALKKSNTVNSNQAALLRSLIAGGGTSAVIGAR